MDLFEYAITERERVEQVTTEAIDRAGRNADPLWKKAALDAVCHIALNRRIQFTTDEVWELLEQQGIRATHEPRALGAVLRTAQSRGLIKSTGNYRKSVRVECHSRPVMIWEAK
jgi:di/tripeptidase